MFSQSAEYVLRVMVHLAAQEGPLTTRQIAAATQVPEGYLSKLLQSLGRAGLLNSQRGLHGGFVLTRPADQITVLNVVQAVDPPQRIHTCPLNIASHGTQLCPLHRRLDDALASVEHVFGETTLADIVGEATTSKPLCEAPKAKPRK